MTLLLDQGLPRTTGKYLQVMGIMAEHVCDLGMAAATDEAILIAARNRAAVVVTLDADFHALLARSRATTPSVIRIRVEGLKAAELASLLSDVVTVAAGELQAGAAASVTLHSVRVRSLPIGM
jgi:predicted nuclease of predicted toxin-antitoxin system